VNLVDHLRASKGRLATSVIDEMYADPFWTERFAARGRKHSEQDIGFHVDYVIQALEARDEAVLERYGRWLQGVLTTRGMCTLHLADSFGRLAAAIGDPTTTRYLTAARTALLYEGGAARAIQERIRDAIVSGTPGRIEDVVYHLSYLADAIALGQPKVFLDHVTWLSGFLQRQGKDAHTLASTLEALARTLDEGPPQDLVTTALRELP
jgi:hypothetical protein